MGNEFALIYLSTLRYTSRNKIHSRGNFYRPREIPSNIVDVVASTTADASRITLVRIALANSRNSGSATSNARGIWQQELRVVFFLLFLCPVPRRVLRYIRVFRAF